jgi:hypothetical protein
MSATEYTIKYPRYCRTRSGISGHKADPARMPSECGDCFGKGLCGRCAEPIPKYTDTCTSCGWQAFKVAHALPGANYV